MLNVPQTRQHAHAVGGIKDGSYAAEFWSNRVWAGVINFCWHHRRPDRRRCRRCHCHPCRRHDDRRVIICHFRLCHRVFFTDSLKFESIFVCQYTTRSWRWAMGCYTSLTAVYSPVACAICGICAVPSAPSAFREIRVSILEMVQYREWLLQIVNRQVAQLWQRDRASSAIFRWWVNLRLNFRSKGYVLRQYLWTIR